MSNASLLRSMLQKLRKDELSDLSSLGESQAVENALSGGDNDQQVSSRNFNAQLPATKQGNLRYSPNFIPKWERRQLFLLPHTLDTVEGPKQDSEDQELPPGKSDEQPHGKKTKPSFETSVTVSERQERTSTLEIQESMSLHEDSSHNEDMCHTQISNISLETKESSGTDESVLGNIHLQEIRKEFIPVSGENIESEAYEDVLPLSSMAESLSQSSDEMVLDPCASVQTHNTTSGYRVRKVQRSLDTSVQTKHGLVKSCSKSGEQPLKYLINYNKIIVPGVYSEDVHRRCSADVTAQDTSLKRGSTGSAGSNTSLGKESDRWKNTDDRQRNITGKLKERWREKRESNRGSGSSQEKEVSSSKYDAFM